MHDRDYVKNLDYESDKLAESALSNSKDFKNLTEGLTLSLKDHYNKMIGDPGSHRADPALGSCMKHHSLQKRKSK